MQGGGPQQAATLLLLKRLGWDGGHKAGPERLCAGAALVIFWWGSGHASASTEHVIYTAAQQEL
jgi:hypothetical protein